jgi:NAD(P)-dependent dehydrogenase (short-subunit alcohol dehydrogenase family)
MPLDVTNQDSIAALTASIASQVNGIDVLINNAGVKPPFQTETFEGITPETLLNTLAVNVAGPLMVVKALVKLLTAGTNPRIANISSQMGSMQWSGGDYYAYCTSKAALNMVTKRLASDLRSRGITTITMHPGWVRTDMGGRSASLSPAESARGIIQVITNLTARQNGAFIKWNGELHAW